MKFKNIYFLFLSYFLSFHVTVAVNMPDIDCGKLPGCEKTKTEAWGFDILGNIIATWIKYVAVIAVIAVMIGGIMMLVSSWDEEKTKKAKNVVIYALIGVLVSVLAWSIIGIINNMSI